MLNSTHNILHVVMNQIMFRHGIKIDLNPSVLYNGQFEAAYQVRCKIHHYEDPPVCYSALGTISGMVNMV